MAFFSVCRQTSRILTPDPVSSTIINNSLNKPEALPHPQIVPQVRTKSGSGGHSRYPHSGNTIIVFFNLRMLLLNPGFLLALPIFASVLFLICFTFLYLSTRLEGFVFLANFPRWLQFSDCLILPITGLFLRHVNQPYLPMRNLTHSKLWTNKWFLLVEVRRGGMEGNFISYFMNKAVQILPICNELVILKVLID